MKIILINRYRKVKWKKIKSDTWQAKKGFGDKNRVFYDPIILIIIIKYNKFISYRYKLNEL